MVAISSDRKMVQAEMLENQNEKRQTDELQEVLLELEVQAANGRIESVDRRNAVFLASGWKQKNAHVARCLISRIGNATARTPAFIRIRAAKRRVLFVAVHQF